MATRWWFKECTKSHPTRWMWKKLAVDGSIEQQSAEFKSYGEAVNDAIRQGFRPSDALNPRREGRHYYKERLAARAG
jgi:hypothetical protein